MTRPVVHVAVLMAVLFCGPECVLLAQGRGAATSAEQFVLTGIILVDGGGGHAWLQEPGLTGDRPVLIRLSESIGPYRLTRIFEDGIELEGPAGRILVPVRNGRTQAGSVPAQVSPDAAPGSVEGESVQAQGDPPTDTPTPADPNPAPEDSPGMRALRDRLDLARRQLGRQPGNPQSEAAPPAAPAGSAPNP